MIEIIINKPIPPINLKSLITTITQQNIRDGYLRKRSEVEQEIVARQQPTLPAKQQAATPVAAQAAPIPRKQAIASPVGKQCPDCGVQNSPTANFCQGCRKKF